uniref:Uncharacterized protein n=1 Tax=Knipowitschia caucasica TaxID=637954 RepID=A0AAV2M4A0_KNICA
MDDSFRAISPFRTHSIIWAFGVEPGYNNMGPGLPVVTQFPSPGLDQASPQGPCCSQGRLTVTSGQGAMRLSSMWWGSGLEGCEPSFPFLMLGSSRQWVLVYHLLHGRGCSDHL